LRDRLEKNALAFRERMTAAGFEIRPGIHPIVPIMFTRFAPEDAPLAQRFARALLDEGIYVKGFFFPVVPRGQSRIRVQLSAAHTPEHVDRAVAAFTKVGRTLGVLRRRTDGRALNSFRRVERVPLRSARGPASQIASRAAVRAMSNGSCALSRARTLLLSARGGPV
jgi:aspartate aminotransferase-like enzyme